MVGSMSLFIDTPVFLYALGVESREREPCRRLISSSVDRGVRLHTDVEVLQEVLSHRLRRTTREQALAECRQLAGNLVVHDVTLEVWHRATGLLESTSIRGRDAFHAAAALLAGFDAIVTTDSDFDGIPGLRRIDPRDT